MLGVCIYLYCGHSKKGTVFILVSLRISFSQGAKVFYLSGLIHGQYPKVEVHNLGRFISVMKFRPLEFRTTHPYMLVDR